MPSPVSKFGYNIINEQFSEDNDSIVLIENSSRFSVESLFAVIKTYSQRSVVTNDTAYPYWENYARVMEDKLAVMLIVRIPLLILPLIYFIVVSVIFYKKHGLHFKDIKAFAERIIDNRHKKAYYKEKRKEDNL
jgi:hypothetical protein